MCADPAQKKSLLLDNVCVQIQLFLYRYIHTDLYTLGCFLLKIALHKRNSLHVTAEEPHADPGLGDHLGTEKKSLGWAIPMSSKQEPCLEQLAVWGARGGWSTARVTCGDVGCWKERRDLGANSALIRMRLLQGTGLWAPDGAPGWLGHPA